MKTFNKLKKEYLKSCEVKNFSQFTIKITNIKLKQFIEYLESQNIKKPDEISCEVIKSYQIMQYERLNSKNRYNEITYQNKLLSSAVQFIKYLKENDYIIHNPFKNFSYAKEPKSLPKTILTPAEAKKIIQAPDLNTALGYRDRTVLEVLYSSGIRRLEAINLKIEEVDYHQGYLNIINGKGKKDRIVPLGRIACKYLENYITIVRKELVKKDSKNFVFITRFGKPFGLNTIGDIVTKYTKLAKIKKHVHPHTFRHSCATSMLKNKADLFSIQKLLGHASIASTQVYTHLSIMDLKETHCRCHPREKKD